MYVPTHATYFCHNYLHFPPKPQGNVAHGCLHGIHMFPGDDKMKCSLLEDFVVYKSWDFGVYHQTTSSVHIKNTVVADSQVLVVNCSNK